MDYTNEYLHCLNVTFFFAEGADPQCAQALDVIAEPDIDLAGPIASSVVSASAPPANHVAPPQPQRPAAHPNGFGRYVASDVNDCATFVL
jgi:hypothetical protein